MSNLYSFYNQLTNLGVLSKTNVDIHSGATLNAVADTYYLLNTDNNSIIVTLPSNATNGDVIGFSDYKGTFSTNSVTVRAAGTDTVLDNAQTEIVLDKDFRMIELIYWDNVWSLAKGEYVLGPDVTASDLIDGFPISSVVPQLADKVLIQDVSSSDSLKTVTITSLKEVIDGLDNFTDTKYSTGFNFSKPSVAFLARGSETHLNIILKTKGVGSVFTSIPDGTAIGGNLRGEYSIDFGLFREQANQVASGLNSVLFGTSNTSSGDYSLTVGGQYNISSGDYSVALGKAANTNNVYGKYAFSSGYENQVGDVQHINQVFRNVVSNNSLNYLTSDSNNTISANNTVALSANGSITVNFVAQAHSADNTKLKTWNGVVSVYKHSNDTDVTVVKQVFNSYALLGDPLWSLDFVADVDINSGCFTFVNNDVLEDVVVAVNIYGLESSF